jgi:hypothetical protein
MEMFLQEGGQQRLGKTMTQRPYMGCTLLRKDDILLLEYKDVQGCMTVLWQFSCPITFSTTWYPALQKWPLCRASSREVLHVLSLESLTGNLDMGMIQPI